MMRGMGLVEEGDEAKGDDAPALGEFVAPIERVC